MIALLLLILTIITSFKAALTRKSIYQVFVILLDGAWIIYNCLEHSYWMAMFWCLLIMLDTRTYERYKANEQKES